MSNEQKEAKIKGLMLTAMETMEELKSLSPDYWRVLVIAFVNEEKSLAKEMLRREPVDENTIDSASLQDQMLTLVHDAIVDTTMGGKPYDPVEVRNWYGYPKNIREIIKAMPDDVFNVTFGNMAQEIVKQYAE